MMKNLKRLFKSTILTLLSGVVLWTGLGVDNALAISSNYRLQTQTLNGYDSSNYVYANNKDSQTIEITLTDKSNNLVANQAYSIWLPTGVSCSGSLNSGNGVSQLLCKSTRATSSSGYVKLTSDERVKASLRFNFKRINRSIYNRTESYFNINSPMTFVAETSAGAEFVKGEVVYEYRRNVTRIYGNTTQKRSIVIPMVKNDQEWTGTLAANHAAASKVAYGKFSYYYRMYDAYGNIFYSRRYYDHFDYTYR